MIRSKVLGTHRNIYDPIGNIRKQHIISVPGYKTLGSQPLLGVCSLRAAQAQIELRIMAQTPLKPQPANIEGNLMDQSVITDTCYKIRTI